MNEDRYQLSVIIVNINRKELLKKCLQSVFREVEKFSAEVIVIDNNSTDGSRNMVSSYFPEVNLIPTSGRKGFAENYNCGIRAARGEYLLVLNNDTELLPCAASSEDYQQRKLLDEMVHRLKREPKVACLGPMLLYPDGKLQAECARNLPTLRDIVFGTLWLDQLFPRSKFFSRLNMPYWDHATERYVECISGACMLIRKSVIEELGNFDEQFFVIAEDTDLCKRIRAAGYRILYVPGFKVVHVSGQTVQLREAYAGKVEAILSMYKYFKKHYGLAWAWLFRLTVALLVLLRILFMENSLVAPLFKRQAFPISQRIVACASLLKWKSLYTGQRV
jgi:GT2 family glycosyltransferase